MIQALQVASEDQLKALENMSHQFRVTAELPCLCPQVRLDVNDIQPDLRAEALELSRTS